VHEPCTSARPGAVSTGRPGTSSGRRPLPARRVPPELEAEVLALTRRRPELEKRSVAVRLGLRIGATAVRSVWLRHGVGTTRRARVAWAGSQGERLVPQRRVEGRVPRPPATARSPRGGRRRSRAPTAVSAVSPPASTWPPGRDP